MKTSEVLRQAKAILWTGIGKPTAGKLKFICHAINRTVLGDGSNWQYIQRTKNMVHSLLRPHVTLEDWLLAKGHVVHRQLYAGSQFRNRARVQATRHAWIDHLIATTNQLATNSTL